MLQGVTGGFPGPAIAAISLGLVGHSALAEQVGRNQRFASTGALVGAALMGIAGNLLSYQSIFLIVVLLGLPMFLALRGSGGRYPLRSILRSARLIMMRVSQQVPGGVILLKDFSLVIFAAGYSCFNLLMLPSSSRRRNSGTQVTDTLLTRHIGTDHCAEIIVD